MNIKCKRLLLERLVCGELHGEKLSEVRSHIESCSDCASFVAGLESERTAFLLAHPFSSVNSFRAPTTPLPWYLTVARNLRQPRLLPAYGAFLVVLVALPMVIRHQKHPDTMYKGAIPLTCMVQRDGRIYPAAELSPFRGGDQIQITFPLTKSCYVSLISIDSRGTVSFYHPDRKSVNCSVTANPGTSVMFPGSIVLDNTSGAELVVALFSPGVLRRDSVEAWAKRQFDACRDLAMLQRKLQSAHGESGAEIATVLLPKEEV